MRILVIVGIMALLLASLAYAQRPGMGDGGGIDIDVPPGQIVSHLAKMGVHGQDLSHLIRSALQVYDSDGGGVIDRAEIARGTDPDHANDDRNT